MEQEARQRLLNALSAGLTRLEHHLDLINRINVFPVADGDTGINMVSTLRGVLDLCSKGKDLRRALLLSARGNSGNILSHFLVGLVEELGESGAFRSHHIHRAFGRGARLAYQGVSHPVEGTMLSLIRRVSEVLPQKGEIAPGDLERVMEQAREAVAKTPEDLPLLQEAGVVDAGALGFLLFLEGFLQIYRPHHDPPAPQDLLGKWKNLAISRSWLKSQGWSAFRCCMDLVLEKEGGVADRDLERLQGMGGNIEILRAGDLVKVHLHTNEKNDVLQWAKDLGNVMICQEDDLADQVSKFVSREINRPQTQRVNHRILTDAAGSVSLDHGLRLQMGILQSYVCVAGAMVPEAEVDRQMVYSQLKNNNARFTTAHASEEELRQALAGELEAHQYIYYVAVGGAYTKNLDMARRIKAQIDPQDRLWIYDSRAAAGQLGLIALACAERAAHAGSRQELDAYIQDKIASCKEYLLPETLTYLARGGRLSKLKAFIGNTLSLKPILCHFGDGVGKEGQVRSQREGLSFVLKRLRAYYREGDQPLIMVQFTDSRPWAETVASRIRRELPQAEIFLQPLSMTSGVHLGPGTWAVAMIRR